MSLDDRVALFQFFFINKEIEPFIDAVTHWSHEIKQSIPSFEYLKNCLFCHHFNIDYEQLQNHSEALGDLFLHNFPAFQDMLLKILFRLVKRIAAQRIATPSIWLDINQLRIKTRPIQLPLETALTQKNGIWQIGNHFLIAGRITQIGPIQPIIIRYLYRCNHGECNHWAYRKPKDRFGAIHCRRCGEITQEDETGRISINSRRISLQPTLGFRLIQLLWW
jgi:DNA replicative helicase MCM subunit Mcm2 (Cdc46/Mcm family)